MAINWYIVAVFVVAVSILGVFAFIAINRRHKAKKLIVHDARNPNRGTEVFYAIFDKTAGNIRLYNNLFTPFQASIMPPVDMRSYTFSDGKLYGYRGVSGHPEDDNIVLCSWPIIGQVGAANRASQLSDAIQNTLSFYEACRPFYINDIVTFTMKKGSSPKSFNITNPFQSRMQESDEDESLEGTVSKIGYEGITVEVLNQREVEVDVAIEGKTQKQKQMRTFAKNYIFPTVHDITTTGLKVLKKADGQKATPAGVDSFFTENWFMTNFGIIPVNDANVMLRSGKEAIAEFNSRVNDRANSRKGWFSQHWMAMTFVLALIGLAIGYAIESYATQSYVSALKGSAIVNPILNAANSILPKG